MADTSIAWCDKSWNPLRGCSRVSEGCRFCFAERTAARFSGPGLPYEGLTRPTKDGPRWTGEIRFVPEKLAEPLRWRKPQRIFVNSMSDLFHEKVTDEQIAAIFGVMAAAHRHTFQVLTKRPARMRAWLSEFMPRFAADNRGIASAPCEHETVLRAAFDALGGASGDGPRLTSAWSDLRSAQRAGVPLWPLPNVHMLVSVEDQRSADERIPLLLDTPAAVRGVSLEPMIGPVDLREHLNGDSVGHETGGPQGWQPGPGLDWVIVGGESGPHARPFDLAWARSVRDQCVSAGVACFVKQMGANVLRSRCRDCADRVCADDPCLNDGLPCTGIRDPAGADPSEWPADLRVRQFPEASR